jgi:DNA-binding NarL/FixJ family response regulator
MAGKIYWTKPGTNELDYEKEPPYPSFNMLADRIKHNAATYVNLVMMASAMNLYNAASDEILKRMNGQAKTIQEQNAKIIELKCKLKKWENQQGKGKRPSKRIQAKKNDVIEMNAAGASNREIGRRLEISETTVRRILKAGCNKKADGV